MTLQQMDLWPSVKKDRTSTFVLNNAEPVHRWFRYSAGFSATWAAGVIESFSSDRGRPTVLDPFAGSGTALLEAERLGSQAYGIEAQPFVARIAKAKLQWRTDLQEFSRSAKSVAARAHRITPELSVYPPLIRKCFPDSSLAALDQLRRAVNEWSDDQAQHELLWLCLASVLRSCSPVGTASWQYILPRKAKARVADPFEAFAARANQMVLDMHCKQSVDCGPRPHLIEGDARTESLLPQASIDLVITSPPYANNYDYGDATRLEMSFFLEIRGWGDLQNATRTHLVRSCTQHVATLGYSLEELLSIENVAPISAELAEVCQLLSEEKQKHGGKKPYDIMVASYFVDLARVWKNLRHWTRPSATVCFVVGDSAPYGVHVPVERWLGELALHAGFSSWRFEKLRDRNIKWKNRKHRVPLHEGRLWVQ